jgi:hypothetical protein
MSHGENSVRYRHKVRGLPEDNAYRETLRFFKLYQFKDITDCQDRKARGQYIFLWEIGIMELQLSQEQLDSILKQFIEANASQCEGCDEEDGDLSEEAKKKLREINKPTKEKTRYIS